METGNRISSQNFNFPASPQDQRLNPHFIIDVMGGVGYTYIRKNACSVFKKMILQTSDSGDMDPNRFQNPSKFMGAYHRVSIKRMARLEQRIVVLRNPVERIISGYINQFLMHLRTPSPEMHPAIETAMSSSLFVMPTMTTRISSSSYLWGHCVARS